MLIKKRYLIPCFIIILNSCSKNTPTYENLFITASALNIRERPMQKSKIVNIIPFGTQVQVAKTTNSEIISKQNNYWYYYPKSNGYIFGNFLSKRKSKLKKKMILTCKDSAGFMQTCNVSDATTTLSLSNGFVKYSYNESYSMYDKDNIKSFGTYLISSNSIIISVKAGKRSTEKDTGKSTVKKKSISKPFKLKLFYKHKLKGFIRESNLKTLQDKKYITNHKKKYLISKTSLLNKKKQSGKYIEIGYFVIGEWEVALVTNKKAAEHSHIFTFFLLVLF